MERYVFQRVTIGNRRGKVVTETLCETRDVETQAALTSYIRELSQKASQSAYGGRSREVQVVGMDYDKYQVFLEKQGSGAKEIDIGNTFPSAILASNQIGCRFNEVAQALSRAERDGKESGIVRGVEFRYVDTMHFS